MLEIFRMQLRQMLDGKRKWLVVLFLALPIGLTWMNMTIGGLGRLRDRRVHHRETAHRITQKELVTLLPAEFARQEDRLFYLDGRHRRPIGEHDLVQVNQGYVVIENGEIWLDPRLEDAPQGLHVESGAFSWDLFCAIYLFFLYPQSICMLLALFYGSSLLGNELDNKTLTYLFTRPVARWRIVVGKYLAIVVGLIPVTAVSVLASWLLLERPGGLRMLSGIELGAGLGLLAYNAVFILLGFLVPRRAMVMALLYGLILEFGLSLLPAVVNTFTITYQLRSLVVAIVDLHVPVELSRIVGGASVPAALLALASMIGIGLWLSARLAARREYVVTDQV